MWRRESVNILTCILMVCPAVLNGADGSRRTGVDLQFSLSADPVTVSVSGMVTDKRTGEPIANALVRGHVFIWKYQGPELNEKAAYLETRTDAQGMYTLEFVTPLTVSGPMKGKDGLCVYVGAPGYETLPQYARPDVTPENTRYENFDFALDEGQRISGTVVDEDARPVAGAVVKLQGGLNGDWDFFGATGQTKTDQAGKFELWITKGRGRWLNITKSGYGTSFFWDYLEKGDMGTLTLMRGGSIMDKILGPDGKGLANCELSIRRYPCGLIDKVLTDAEGNYILRGVPGDPSLIEFLKRKNGSCTEEEARCEVYTRLDPEAPLAKVPTYMILAKDGQTVTGPNLTVGANTSVSGRLVASNHTYGLGGLLVRLDGDWGTMVEADADGNFRFPFVLPGKHRLTAYLPHNLRYDRGIGQAQIEVEPGKSLAGVQIELADLAELRVQYLNADGNPLEGITAGATWSQSGDGGWTEGTYSDKNGWAVLYLYPDEVQYVRGFDHSGRSAMLVAEAPEKVCPKAGQILDSLRIVMLPCARLHGRLVDDKGVPAVEREALCTLAFADGAQWKEGIRTDAEGRFDLNRLTPGFATLSVEVDSVLFTNVIAEPFELKPGQTRDLGDVALKGGLSEDQMLRERRDHPMQYAAEVRLAAERLFEKIKTADYEKGLATHEFPIQGYYQTYTRFDLLIEWMCTTFKDNPIIKVELGQAFLSPEEINGQKNLPTVPYKLTLKDGTKLEGNLPFKFTLEGDTPHWYGTQGIDWHLRDAKPQ
jgi:protocatechuate 3,4-dioxygenase beta subunit